MRQVWLGLALLVCGSLAAQTKRALLIGIDTYQPEGTGAAHPAGCVYGRCELGAFPNLQGSVNDATAMADLLTSPKFGFAAANVALLTNPAAKRVRSGVVVLPAEQTTHDGILAAMKKYLVDAAKAGDTVVFYDASHGSLRVNSKGTKLEVNVDGKAVHADSTLVPADAYKGGFDVRDREMTRIFNAALDKGVHVVAIYDSCHSGGATRGLGEYRSRSLAFDPRDVAEAGDGGPAPTERAGNPALVLTAVQQDQEAKETKLTDGEPHGAFTAALIESLQSLPVDAPAALVYRRVRAVLEGNGVPGQDPELDATAARREQPLFGADGAGGGAKTLRTAALQTGADGTVWLDVGRVAGIGVGTTFVSASKTVVRVKTLEGLARAAAEVVSPAGAAVRPGEIFELKDWVPEQRPMLVWHAPANLSRAEIDAAVAQVKAAGVALVSDPAEERWTERLDWDGNAWTLTHAAGGVASVGRLLAGLKLPVGARVWMDLPPAKELAAGLAFEAGAAVQGTEERGQASYLLSGTVDAKGVAYAWFHKAEFEAEPPAETTRRHTAGCSTTSSYPVRSGWTADAGELTALALRLAKVQGWLQMADAPGSAGGGFYGLALSRGAGGGMLGTGEAVKSGESLTLSLVADAPPSSRRWVYVLDIDCQGNGNLLYPIDYAENQFPKAGMTAAQVPLSGARTIDVGEPYGVDTLVMLSTEQPLPDPEVLNFVGVGAGVATGARGLAAQTALSQLLGETSSGTRGFKTRNQVPTNWGVELVQLVSEAPR